MVTLKINERNKLSHIAPEIYGHFSEHLGRCIYEGIFVGEDSSIPNENGMRTDVVTALKALQVPLLRWPGGCFADEYHWQDGIGPKNTRKKMINTHWGGVVEDNSFGTHEFMELCRQLGCKTYVNGNVGSGTVREMSEWVEYMTFDGVSPMAQLRQENGHKDPWKVDYFGVGNENWGCGGNMRPEYYGNLYRQYQTYVRNYHPDRPIQKVCCGPNVDVYEWTRVLLDTTFTRCPKDQHGQMDLLSLHYYVVPHNWEHKGSATEFTPEEWYLTLHKALYMDELIRKHGQIMDEYDPEKAVGLSVDEWGAWYDVEPGTNPGFLYQQNSLRDALVAGITLNIFNKHSDRVRLACLAQMVNVLQSVILTEGEQMLLTPTYHVLHMYRYHQNAHLLESSLENVDFTGIDQIRVPKLTESVSVDDQGIITVTLANLSATEGETVRLQLAQQGYRVTEAKIVSGEAINSHNTFEAPETVTEEQLKVEGLEFDLPAASVVMLRLEK